MVIEVRIEATDVVTMVIGEITVFSLEINITMVINKAIVTITGQDTHNCHMCHVLLHKMVSNLKINHKCHKMF